MFLCLKTIYILDWLVVFKKKKKYSPKPNARAPFKKGSARARFWRIFFFFAWNNISHVVKKYNLVFSWLVCHRNVFLEIKKNI